MKKKNIFILLGHTDKETYNGALADAYEKGARDAGHDVRRVNIGELSFDPILHKGYKEIQELEPDIKQVQEDIRWANHIAIFYPTWWGSTPAILKGLFDRMIIPGFGYKYYTKFFWHGLLRGRTGRLVTTMDTPFPRIIRFYFGDYIKVLQRTVIEFCGIRPTRITRIAPCRAMSEAKHKKWLMKMEKMGKKGK